MGVDRAGQDFEFEVSIRSDGNDPGDASIGVIVTGDEVTTDYRHHTILKVDRPSPESAVIAHVHEVHEDIAVIDG